MCTIRKMYFVVFCVITMYIIESYGDGSNVGDLLGVDSKIGDCVGDSVTITIIICFGEQ